MMNRKTEILVLVASFGLLLTACKPNAQSYLDKADAFLAENNYEEAIISFTNAIEIDEKNIAAYAGRANAYARMAQYDNAVADYQMAIQLDEAVPEYYDEIVKISNDRKDYSTAFEYTEKKQEMFGEESLTSQEKTIKEYAKFSDSLAESVEAENYERTTSLLSEQTYREITLNARYNGPVIFPAENLWIGVYWLGEDFGAKNPYFDSYAVYFGDMTDGKREGNGFWICRGLNHTITIERGDWKNDRPNGKFEFGLSESRYSVEGTVVDGLLEGDAEITLEMTDELTKTFTAHFIHGKPEILETMETYGYDGYLIAQIGDHDFMLYIFEPEKTYGVTGYADTRDFGWLYRV